MWAIETVRAASFRLRDGLPDSRSAPSNFGYSRATKNNWRGHSEDPGLAQRISSISLNWMLLRHFPIFHFSPIDALPPSLRGIRCKVPYLIHTGFEFPSMLEGRKPLAAFLNSAQWLAQELSSYDRFVREGRFTRRIIERGGMRKSISHCPAKNGELTPMSSFGKQALASGATTVSDNKANCWVTRLAKRLVVRKSKVTSFHLSLEWIRPTPAS